MRRILPKHVGSPVIPMNREICWMQFLFALSFYQTLIHQRKIRSFIGTPQTLFISLYLPNPKLDGSKGKLSTQFLRSTGSAS